jgi:hypothetical protein
LRGIQQNANRGIASIDGRDVGLAIVIEVSNDKLRRADAD